jgi:hypothetical protein|tara:strand:- start:55 stop:255 length:201 start_codon:yes stop_codon:yes gene_type:complete
MNRTILGVLTSITGWLMVASGLFLWNMPNINLLGLILAVMVIIGGLALNYLAFLIWIKKEKNYESN